MTVDLELHEARRTVRQFWGWANLCQCGNPDVVLRALSDGLNAHGEPGAGFDGGPDLHLDNPMWVFAMYALDGWELTDHGGSVYGAWLTPDGIRLRDALTKVDFETVFDNDWWDIEALLKPDAKELSEGEWKAKE